MFAFLILYTFAGGGGGGFFSSEVWIPVCSIVRVNSDACILYLLNMATYARRYLAPKDRCVVLIIGLCE